MSKIFYIIRAAESTSDINFSDNMKIEGLRVELSLEMRKKLKVREEYHFKGFRNLEMPFGD